MKSKLPKYTPPSAYTPFLRRFTDERAADLAEMKALYNTVTARFNASIWAKPDIIEQVNSAIAEQVAGLVTLPPTPVSEAMDRCQLAVLTLETTLFQTAVIKDWSVLSLKEQVDLRRYLRAQEHFLGNEERVFGLLTTALTNVFAGLVSSLPTLPGEPGAFTVPLHTSIDVHDVVDRIIGTLSNASLADAGLFTDLNDRIYRNICAASNLVPYEDHKRPLITAADSDLGGVDLVEAYLGNTPFEALLKQPVPFGIDRKAFSEHGAIFAPSGHGKTQMLQNLIVGFLNEPDPPAMFILDSQGSMLKKIERLQCFADRLQDRLVVLDPPEPALNFFQFDGSNTEVLELATYLFAALDRQLTAKQSTAIPYLLKLLKQIPGATLDTLREIMEDKSKFEASPYTVIKRDGKDDYWLNLGVAFKHDDGDGYNLLLQAQPLDGKLVMRTYKDEAEPEDAKAKPKYKDRK